MTAATAPPDQAALHPLHSVAEGFVLTGGGSSRMGRDKAMLPWKGKTLLEHVAHQVWLTTGSVRLVGRPAICRPLRFEVIPDAAENAGPLGGIVAALRRAAPSWVLITSCDLPNLDWRNLAALWNRAEDGPRVDAVIPLDRDGRLHPLCAFYHRRTLPAWEAALLVGNLRLQTVARTLNVHFAAQDDATWLTNVNTPAEWQSALEGNT